LGPKRLAILILAEIDPCVDSSLRCLRMNGVSSGESGGSKKLGTNSVGSIMIFSRRESCTRILEM